VALGVSLSGLAVFALAVGGFIVQTQRASREVAPAAAPQSAAHRVELPDVGIAQIVYEPGHSSGWHVHAGVHSVVRAVGALTVYDQACGRQDFPNFRIRPCVRPEGGGARVARYAGAPDQIELSQNDDFPPGARCPLPPGLLRQLTGTMR
jgi:hypothetical protein